MIPAGTIVKNKDGRQGVTFPDMRPPMDCLGPGEVLVEYEGTNTGEGTLETELEVVGPEDPKPDPRKCGAGQGAECCRFVTVSVGGFCCERHTQLRHTLIFQSGMSARRQPTEAYPACMKFPGREG